MSTPQSSRNATNQFLGSLLEAKVRAGCDVYEQAGIAMVAKVPTPIKHLSNTSHGARFMACYSERTHCDYFGVFTSKAPSNLVGLAIAVECKATSSDRIPYSEVRERQRAWLDATAAGGVAMLLIWFNKIGHYRLVQWSDMKPGTSAKPEDGVRVDADRFLDPVLLLAEQCLASEGRAAAVRDIAKLVTE